MTEMVLTARIEAEVASAKAGIQAVQAELGKLTRGALDASAAGKGLGAALMIPPPVALATMAPTLTQIRTALDQQSRSATALAAAQSILGGATQTVAVDMRLLAGVQATLTAAARDEIAALTKLDQEIEQLRRSVAPAISAQEMLATAHARVTAAVKAGLITQAQANTLADQARVKFTGLSGPLAGLEKGSFAAAGGARMLGQQLSQVFQQGAVTGNYLGALAVQLPDMALGFGGVAIAASIVATVALPMIISAFGGGKTAADQARDANASYGESIQLLMTDVSDATTLQDRYAAAVKSGSAATVAALQAEAATRVALLDLDQLDLAAAQQAAEIKRQAQLAELAGAQQLLNERKSLSATAVQSGNADEIDRTNVELSIQQQTYDGILASVKRLGLEYDLNKAKIAGNEAAIIAARDALASMAAGVPPITDALGTATGAAGNFSSALSVAAGYAASIQASINGINFSNIGKAAELAALMRGMSPAQASNAGTVAESAAKLAPMINAGDNPSGQRSQNEAANQLAGLSAGLATQTATDAAIAKWIKDHPVAGSGGGGGGGGVGAGGGAATAGIAALTSEAVKAMDKLDLALAAINEKVKAGLMSTADAVTAVAAAKGNTANELAGLVAQIDKLGPSSGNAADQIRGNMQSLAADLKVSGSDLASTLAEGFKSPFADFLSGAKTAQQAMADLGDFVIRKFAEMAAERAVTGFIEPLFNGLFAGIGRGIGLGAVTAHAKGGVPGGAPLAAYSNQVLDRPTLFPMRGGVGLMAEAGPEAILPVSGGGILAILAGREQRLPLARGADGTLGVVVPEWQSGADRAPQAFARGGLIIGGQSDPLGAGGGAGGGAAAGPRVAVNITTPPGHTARVQERIEGGTLNLDVMVEALENRMAANVRSGRGALGGAFSDSFGLPRATR